MDNVTAIRIWKVVNIINKLFKQRVCSYQRLLLHLQFVLSKKSTTCQFILYLIIIESLKTNDG